MPQDVPDPDKCELEEIAYERHAQEQDQANPAIARVYRRFASVRRKPDCQVRGSDVCLLAGAGAESYCREAREASRQRDQACGAHVHVLDASPQHTAIRNTLSEGVLT